MDLSALRNKAAPLTVEYDGEHLSLTYRPHQFEDDDFSVFRRLQEVEGFEPVIPILARLISAWDLTDEGSMVKVSQESVTALPPLLRMVIVKAIVDDMMSRGNVLGSSSTSLPASGNGQIGPTASTTPNGQVSLHGTTPASQTPPGALYGGIG